MRGKSRYIAYLAPVLMLILGIIIYKVVLTARYNNAVSFLDWLFSGTDNIIATLRSADIVLGKVYRILLTKTILWVWSVGFLFSLFWCGYTVQNNRVRSELPLTDTAISAASAAIILGAEQKYREQHVADWRAIVRQSVALADRLAGCSKFGYGNAGVTAVESSICLKLQEIEALYREQEASCETIRAALTELDSLLSRRESLSRLH